ncbi:Nucleoporin NUP37 [Pleurostoma richardsiae]|uniref:Nucleoporin NUP37 n=1 Tax=Pleurostoma richardsiae TaxID=41990 RepID=A0AA38VFD7_9PEZI|nr:Nucleoporin NUP37 [Pleurostoma richardsiae]
MTASYPNPRIRRTAQNTQYTYNLNRRVHDVVTYPVLSPQGATIILCGQENGVTIIWRGGRRLKAPKPEAPKQAAREKSNGADDAVMVIDSDEEEAPPAAAAPFADKPEFEDDSIEDDASYPEVVQTLDLSFGTDVYHIGVLPMAPCAAEDAAWGGADILKDKMVFAVSCATTDAYIITLPLTPPSHESKARPELRSDLLAASAGKGKWGETLISLGGQTKYSDGIAMTLVKQRSQSLERSKSVERLAPSPTRVIVAAHSREASGVLRFWDVSPSSKHANDRPIVPFQTEYLPSPLNGIAFNPTHLTQLLTVASPHAVRIYDYSIPSIPADDTSEGPFPSQGYWLLSLYPPFVRGSATSTSRKPILAAEWIAHGRAIITLLGDGQWGIWDIDGAAPSVNGTAGGLFGKTGSGIRGAALSSFSTSGYLEGTSPLRNPGSQRTSGQGSGDFVPMTPHTRRESLLSSSFSGGPERLATVRGGIDVLQLPPLRGSATGDESAVLWISGSDHVVSVIPGISRFWDAQVRRGAAGAAANPFGGAQPARMVRLAELNAGLLGERCCGVSAVAKFQHHHPSASATGHETNGNNRISGEGLPVDVLVLGESRLVAVQEGDVEQTQSLPRKLKRLVPTTAPAEPVTAISVYPPPEKPTVTFNFASRAGSVRGKLLGKSFAEPSEMEVEPTGPAMQGLSLPSRPRNAGLEFADELDVAADATYDMDAADRDVEQEMMDIMELDRELEHLEEERQAGTKRVFFEEG